MAYPCGVNFDKSFIGLERRKVDGAKSQRGADGGEDQGFGGRNAAGHGSEEMRLDNQRSLVS